MTQAATHWSWRGLQVGLLGTLALFLLSQSLSLPNSLEWALIGGLMGWVGTGVGGLFSLATQRMKPALEDGMLGFAAGMMLAAAAFSLVLPGIELGRASLQSDATAAVLVALGLGLGAVIMTIIERVLPHEHPQAGPQGAVTSRVDRVWLFVMAMAIHNFPEGLAVGVSFAGPESREGLSLATAIAIQDVPEGLAVALALRAAGLPRGTAALIAVATGLFEPMGAVLGFLFASALGVAMPIAMGFAAGAMLFIVSHEVIPETQRRGNQASATWGLMAGFTLMMVLDTTL